MPISKLALTTDMRLKKQCGHTLREGIDGAGVASEDPTPENLQNSFSVALRHSNPEFRPHIVIVEPFLID
jgi:hypothetical protein